jgi:serine/threonine-protein kinase
VADTVKVLDFGLVKVIDDPGIKDGITQANHIVGTPHYLSPEAIAHPEEVGPATDIYAIGALAFFLLTGREPFPGQSVIEVCSQHLHAPPPSPSALTGQTIPADLEALILRCLAKRPQERPPDGAALGQELAAIAQPGWSPSDAASWWQMHHDEIHRNDKRPSVGSRRQALAESPTELAIDLGQR